MALYLGIDASTQGVKAVVIDATSIVAEAAVNFGLDLPEFGAPHGFLPNPDPLIKEANPAMWVAGLHRVLAKLADAGVPLADVAGISGSGQQHGSVYLDAAFQLTRAHSPIWMDRSTTRECRELDERFGNRLQRETGSPAIERFTGPQIRKFARENPAAYARTRHIHLVSSYLCSILCGWSAPLDTGDGAGMNLLNLATLNWDAEIAEFTAPGLLEKLPPVVRGDELAGGLTADFARYGLRAGTPVAVWSGDNPSSLVGMGGTEPGTAVVSLGTSDTFFAAMPEFRTDPAGYGHVFGNPAGGFMSLICFTNGSLAREKIRESCGVSWEYFDRGALEETAPGNAGRFLLPYFEPESTPLVLEPGVRRNFTTASPAETIRAVLETQVLAMRHYTRWVGDFRRLRLTGGASGAAGFRQIFADVFNAEVETIAIANSAGLGAALRAMHAVTGTPFPELASRFCSAVTVTRPQNPAIYQRLAADFANWVS